VFMDKRRASVTVLVVEDDDDTRMVYSDGLGYAGYRVITASTGIDGLRAAHDERPDVILLDLSLSGADGWEVVHLVSPGRSEEHPYTGAALIVDGRLRYAEPSNGALF